LRDKKSLLLHLLLPPFPLEEQISSSSASSSPSFLLELCPFVIRNRSWNFWQFAERQTSSPFFFCSCYNLNPTPNQIQETTTLLKFLPFSRGSNLIFNNKKTDGTSSGKVLKILNTPLMTPSSSGLALSFHKIKYNGIF
jgi:hypothetical protein